MDFNDLNSQADAELADAGVDISDPSYQQTPQREDPTPSAEQTPTPSSSPALVDARTLVAELAAQLPGLHAPQQQQAPAPKLTPEQAREAIGWFKITPEWTTKFQNLETQAQALQEFQEANFNSILRVLESAFADHNQSLDQRLAKYDTIAEDFQKQSQEKQWDGFYKTYTSLADDKYRMVVNASAQALQQSGAKFKTSGELYKAIAELADTHIRKLDPNFKLAGAPPRVPNSIPGSSGGSGGGAGGSRPKDPASRFAGKPGGNILANLPNLPKT